MGVLSYTTPDGIAGVAACASAAANNVAPVIPASANVSNSLFTGSLLGNRRGREPASIGTRREPRSFCAVNPPEWGGSSQRIGDERDGPLALGLKTYLAMT